MSSAPRTREGDYGLVRAAPSPDLQQELETAVATRASRFQAQPAAADAKYHARQPSLN
jgi:hypothetical protein